MRWKSSSARLHRQMRLVTGFEIVNHGLSMMLIGSTAGAALWLWSQGQVGVGAVAAATAMALRLNGISHWVMWEMASLFPFECDKPALGLVRFSALKKRGSGRNQAKCRFKGFTKIFDAQSHGTEIPGRFFFAETFQEQESAGSHSLRDVLDVGGPIVRLKYVEAAAVVGEVPRRIGGFAHQIRDNIKLDELDSLAAAQESRFFLWRYWSGQARCLGNLFGPFDRFECPFRSQYPKIDLSGFLRRSMPFPDPGRAVRDARGVPAPALAQIALPSRDGAYLSLALCSSLRAISPKF